MGRMVVMAQFIYSKGRSGVSVTDYRDLVKTMREVEPALLLEMRRGFRKVSKPMVKSIKSGIPKQPPTKGIHISRPQNTPSGFNPRVVPGRLTWGANQQNRKQRVDSVLVKTPRVRAKLRKGVTETSIARVQVENAAVVMADMAGTVNKVRRTVTRPYLYSRGGAQTGKFGTTAQLITMRQHKINGQGKAMIRALGAKKRSRYVYPAAEGSLPAVRLAAEQVLQNGFNQVNTKLRS